MWDLPRSVSDTVFENLGRAAGRVQEERSLPADLLESDDAYLVVFDAPGVESHDVQVRYEDGRVEVRLDRFRDHRDGFEMLFPGRGLSLKGSARIPADAQVDPESAAATVRDDGTLTVRLPKTGGEGRDEEANAGNHSTETDDEAA